MWYNGNTWILHLTASNIANYHGETYIHSGNIGSYAFIPRGDMLVSNVNADDYIVNGAYLNQTGNGSGSSNFPVTYGMFLTFSNGSPSYVAQISLGSDSVHYRRKIDSWSTWKQIALIDSNVASATKLQTARTIWGQSFDGTGNVSGRLYGVTGIDFDTNVYGIRIDDYGNVVFRTSASVEARDWSVKASNDTKLFQINNNGNVLIGTTTDNGYKLNVSGVGLFTESTNIYGVIIGNSNVIDGYAKGSSSANLYINHYTAGDVYLATGGGKVGIGTTSPQYKLDVSGAIHASDGLLADNSISVKVSSSRWINIGSPSFTWSGVNRYGLIWGADSQQSTGDIYTMIAFPHIPFLVNGWRDYSGNTYGAIIRLEASVTSDIYWDMGISYEDTFSIKRGDSHLFSIFSSGNGSFGGGTKNISAQSWSGTLVIGEDGKNKAVIGYCGSKTNGIVFGAHNTALNAWADVNISGSNIYLRNDEKIISTIHSSGMNVTGTIYATTGIYSDGYVSSKGQNTSSDMRLKNVLNEVVLDIKDIANAPSVRFAWKNGGGVDVGSSAQYWQGLLPDAVKEQNSLLEMQYGNIALLSAIAIAKKVETHEERIARLEKENKELRNEINCLRYGA